MLHKKLAFGLLAVVAFASPAVAQDQSQTSIQRAHSQNAAVENSVAVTDAEFDNRQFQFEDDSFHGYGYDYGTQEQLSVQEADTSNAAVERSIAVTDTDFKNRQIQFEQEDFYSPYLKY